MLWRLAIILVCSGAAFIPNGAAVDTYDYHDDNHDYHDDYHDNHDNYDDGDQHDYGDHHEELGRAITEMFKAEFQQVCRENKAAYHIKAAEKAIDELHECLHDTHFFEELEHQLHDLENHQNLIELLSSICVSLRKSHKCLIRFAPSIKPCLPLEDYKLFVMEFNATFNTVHYLCYNTGQRIAVFLTTHGIGCIAKKSERIRECMLKVNDNAGITSHHDLAILKIKELCDIEDRVANCYFTPMRNCESPIPAKLVEGLYKYVRHRSPCNTVKPLDTGYYWNFNIKKRGQPNYLRYPDSSDVKRVEFNSNIKANFE